MSLVNARTSSLSIVRSLGKALLKPPIAVASSGGAAPPPTPDQYWDLSEVGASDRVSSGALGLVRNGIPADSIQRLTLGAGDPAMGGYGVVMSGNGGLFDVAPSLSNYLLANNNKTYAFWYRQFSPTMGTVQGEVMTQNLNGGASRWRIEHQYNSGDPYLRFFAFDAVDAKILTSEALNFNQPGKWFAICFGHDADNNQLFFFAGDKESGETTYVTAAFGAGGVINENATTDDFKWPSTSAGWNSGGNNIALANYMLWEDVALTEDQCLGYFNGGDGWKP